MVIETLRLDEVEDSHYNPRQELEPSDPEWKQIEASLDEFGLVEPLVFNRTTGRLIGGHQRKKILQAQGVEEAPFSVVELDESREKVLNIALNRGGRWDEGRLAGILDDLRDESFLPATGFDQDAIEALLADVERQTAGDFLDDLTTGADEALEGAEEGSPSFATDAGEEHVNITFRVPTDMRESIVLALVRAREVHEIAQTDVGRALAQICIDWMATNGQD